MFNGKYGKVLTVVMVVVIIAILVLLGFLGFDMYNKYFTKKGANEALEQFEKQVVQNQQNTVDGNVTPNINPEATVDNTVENNGELKKVQYKGFNVAGKIEIPKIKLSYPILEKTTEQSIEYSVAILTGPGLNKVGNTVIIGHNYRNGLFFSDLKKVELNDKIYITDETGERKEYTIYNKYETTPEDADYLIRDTAGNREITLQTCTDDVQNRLIIWAREK